MTYKKPFADEISILDAVEFVAQFWKKLVIAAICGALLGLGLVSLNKSYEASAILRNNEALGIQFVRQLQLSLPSLAREMVEKNQTPEGTSGFYGVMGGAEFWRKSLIPMSQLSSADIKDFAIDTKDASNSILFLKVNVSGQSADSAIKNAVTAIKFLRNGGAYLAIREFYAAQRFDLEGDRSKIESKIHYSLVELDYKKKRLKALNESIRNLPTEARAHIQSGDSKNFGATYLPAYVQILNANTEIATSMEELERLQDQLTRLEMKRHWLERSESLISKNYLGLELSGELLVLEGVIRDGLSGKDPKEYIFLDSVRNFLLLNEARFRRGLVQEGAESIRDNSSILKGILGGAVAALLLMLIFLLGQRYWLRIKGGTVKALSL